MNRDDGVNDFLARIKELGAQRDREDEERTRQLEKEILAGRQARQDRRAGTYLSRQYDETCSFIPGILTFRLLG